MSIEARTELGVPTKASVLSTKAYLMAMGFSLKAMASNLLATAYDGLKQPKRDA